MPLLLLDPLPLDLAQLSQLHLPLPVLQLSLVLLVLLLGQLLQLLELLLLQLTVLRVLLPSPALPLQLRLRLRLELRLPVGAQCHGLVQHGHRADRRLGVAQLAGAELPRRHLRSQLHVRGVPVQRRRAVRLRAGWRLARERRLRGGAARPAELLRVGDEFPPIVLTQLLHLPPLDAGCAVIRVPVFDGRVARLGVLLDAREQALHLGAPIH
mmetsp:Transcript_10308/g.34097  ORF Transcript_10308/g.34097 Transcript_10308/m.34097 type:complete len:212 (+) Transcript_10308:1925-2560(+)